MSAVASAWPISLVCPLCQGALQWKEAEIACYKCGAEFTYRDGTPDLIAGGRFDDEDDPERASYEALANQYTSENYLLPMLRRVLAGVKKPRVLSLGCGIGRDVDLLVESGFEVFGIDCGNRTHHWADRLHRNRLYLANGKHLPFENGEFDMVYCGCVFPHVGVHGDTNRVTPEYLSERRQIAREMSRVLKPGGRMMVSSPNRLFPLDLFHGRNPAQPYPRWNSPASPFLLSAADYRAMFRAANCGRFETLPVTGYWGFIRMKQRWKGRLLAFPVETIFNLVSREPLRFLRASPINPWLVMLIHRNLNP